ncbi:cytochrome C assembly family protein [Solemya velesiana gill symbiont]|uniref:Cytochrome C biogenesis protein n=1 Tax=Solemya velesiana gill symbiont TaxID=1918948 RepID=A0A1T2KY54_9GAMM|nr:cytochrome c biogenesis protein CcsA [Solemya velesiana gill symbiont]OOZ37762.1 cytochrome C biogenesis protein [Solemya velesiana gill symbiont]
MNTTLIASLAIACYLASAIVIAIRLFRPAPENKLPRGLGLGLIFIGLNLHAAMLFQSIMSNGGINLSFFGAASLIAWTALLLLLFSSINKPVENLGIALLPVAAVVIILQLHFPAKHFLSSTAPWGLQIHVLISLLAYSLLALASVQAVLLAVQDHHLRHRHPGGFIRSLPPLQTMEVLLFEMIILGFALLTLGLISGFVFLEDIFAQRLVHKTILSIAAWLVFGTLLWGRFRFGWRGQKALIWTLVGFVVLMLAYFGSKAVIELILT